tara:strand:- start:1576 stop:2871 length:1296 start_codon:yes stop_codon:yes gene_type:complete
MSKYLTLNANNVPASGRVSFARGNPILTFTIGRQAADLDMSSIRVSGGLDIWRTAAGVASGLRPTSVAASELMASQKLGVFGAIDQLVFRHAETKQVAEHIRHYNRFMSSYLPIMAGTQDQIGHMSESALIMPNYDAFQQGVVRNTATSEFCIPLPSGMTLGGETLPLDTFPLEIEVHLSPDSQFFYSSDGTTTNLADCFYELSDLSLTCEVRTKEVSAPTSGAFSFNSITSYFSTLESTNAIINYNLGLSKVLASFVNFVPSSFVNNLAQDGSLTYMPSLANGTLAPIDSISFLRNGERFPYAFEVDTNVKEDPTTRVVDSQMMKAFLGSIVPESVHTRTSIGPVNSNRAYDVSDNTTTFGYRIVPDGGASYGVGVLYDMLDSEGVDFKDAQFSIQMTTQLTDGNPVSAYLFIKSKVTVAFSSDGVEVIM